MSKLTLNQTFYFHIIFHVICLFLGMFVSEKFYYLNYISFVLSGVFSIVTIFGLLLIYSNKEILQDYFKNVNGNSENKLNKSTKIFFPICYIVILYMFYDLTLYIAPIIFGILYFIQSIFLISIHSIIFCDKN